MFTDQVVAEHWMWSSRPDSGRITRHSETGRIRASRAGSPHLGRLGHGRVSWKAVSAGFSVAGGLAGMGSRIWV